MKIGILSDTHGRADATVAAIRLLRERGVELILHCGDVDSPATVRLFTGVVTHFVFGNWDLDKGKLRSAMREIGAVCHGELGRLELAGKRIAWLHGHVRGQRHRLEVSQEWDFMFYGHSHKVEAHRSGRTLVLNPGALHRAKVKTVAIVNVVSSEWERVVVEGHLGKGGERFTHFS
jgi:putative phosphoesterase